MNTYNYWELALAIGVGAGAVVYVWATIRNQKSKADSDTIASYKQELDILSVKVKRLEEDSVVFAADKIKLTAQLQQLEVKNEALTAALALRNPDFEKKFAALVAEITLLRKDFQTHYEEDKKNFGSISNSIADGYKMMTDQVSKIQPTLDSLVEVANRVQNKYEVELKKK